MVLEIMGLPYTMVTGFPSTAQVNKAMLQNEINFTDSSLPGYQTQVIPQIIKPGVGAMLFYYPIIGPDGKPAGNPELAEQGVETFDKVYAEAFGKPPSGPKFDALLLVNDLSTKMQRAVMLPKNSPPESVTALRQAFTAVGQDPDFIADYKRITGEAPDLVSAAEIKPLFERMRHVDPVITQMVKESVGPE
jgi:hypothetical protein